MRTRDRSLSIGNGGWGGLSIHLDFIRERSWITLTKSRGPVDGWLEDMWINFNHLIEGHELLKIRTVSHPTIWCLQVLLCPGFYYTETKVLIHRPRLDRTYFTNSWLVLVLSLDVSYFFNFIKEQTAQIYSCSHISIWSLSVSHFQWS